MCEIKLHVKLPIFVARQWVRHRTANINEYSARYSILDNEFYIPEKAQLQQQSQTNMQGRDAEITSETQDEILAKIENGTNQAYQDYEWMLENGLARELARNSLPVNIYTQWYWKIDLHNLLHFIMLRADSHAQYEIRAYADALAKIVEKWVPLSFEAFADYKMNGKSLSAHELKLLKAMLKNNETAIKEIKKTFSAGELREFYQKLELEESSMKVDGNTLRPGNVIEHKSGLWKVVKTQHVKPGKGGAFLQAELKNIRDNTKLNERFRSAETVERIRLEQKPCQFLYQDGDSYHFMDNETYNQLEVSKDLIGEEQAIYLQDGMEVIFDMFEEEALGVTLPEHVTLTITDAESVVKGQTQSGSFKPAICENGARVMVPQHIETNTAIIVNTTDGSYVERAKNK